MASGENALRGQIMELREKIVAIKEEIAQLQKRRKVHIAKLKLMVGTHNLLLFFLFNFRMLKNR